MSDIYAKALRLVEKNKNTVVASVDEDGYPNMKMMFNTRGHEGISLFYFSTNTSSLRVSQFLKNPKACLYFSDTRFFNGLMIKGKMEVCMDDGLRQKIWRKGDEMYYPLGVADPDYCVLRFISESGRYYAGFKSEDFSIGEGIS